MGKTLSILAKLKDGTDEDDDDDITAVRIKLDNISKKPSANHVFARASTLKGVRKELTRADLDAFDLIQIIGHGSPGEIWMNGDNQDKTTEDTLVFLLDSNPTFYRVLDHIKGLSKNCRILLVGCNVGAESHVSRAADGPTLLFDLARMWDRQVAAPTCSVGAQDLDEQSGIFIPTKNGQSRIHVAIPGQFRVSSTWDAPTPSPLAPGPGDVQKTTDTTVFARVGAGATTLGFAGLRGIPLVGIPNFESTRSWFEKLGKWFNSSSRGPGLRLGPDRLQRLPAFRSFESGSFVGDEVEDPRLLAAAEFRLQVVIDGQQAEGEIIANNRLLRVRTKTGFRYFEFRSESQKDVNSMTAAVVKSIMTPEFDDR